MARVSKKVSAAQREAENAQHRIWKTAIYARLSDFDDVLRDTESLEVQISYIKEYIDHRDDLMLLDVFADKRCTGMNFDRPEFERLLKALQERKVNCIVVKDFSRLGRNFVETGQYLEQVFPLFGVRFIAINDNYDSLNSQSRDGMLVPIKSMINEMYSKDLSQKIQSCFRSKEARGEIYTPVPFGYKKNQQNHLILDEEVSDVVVRIFLWKKSGMKEREIAKKLSAQGIQQGALKGFIGIHPNWSGINAEIIRSLCLSAYLPEEAESRRMNVGKDVIRILGSPAYICVLQRKDRKSIAITPCAAEHPMSFKVPDRLLTDGQCRMMINGIQFIQVLLEANGLAAGKDHQFKGRYDAEKNAVIISLEKDEQSALSPQKCTT